MMEIGIFQKRSVHGMFIFIVFSFIMTSVVLMMFIKVTADIEDMENSSIFVIRRGYLQEEFKRGSF